MLFEIFVTVAIGLVISITWLLRKPAPLWREKRSYGSGSRPFGAFETIMAGMGKKGEANVSTIIFIRSKFPLTEVIVRKALVALSQQFQLLRMRLGKVNGKYTYMKEIEDFRVDLEVCHTKDWKGLMEDEAPKIFDAEKGPLWKVKFIPETSYEDEEEALYPYQAACIFGFHHAIIDAKSFFRFFGEFVDRLNAIKENVEHLVKSTPLLPPVDAYIDDAKIYSPKYNLKANLISVLGMLISTLPIMPFLLKALAKPALLMKNLGVEIDRNPKAARKTFLIPIQLTKQQTTDFLLSCKRHKTTVHCAIQTAGCLAYAAMADRGKVIHSHDITCRLSVDLRRFVAAQADCCGMFVSIILMNTTIGPALAFWDIVREVTGDLQAKLKSYVPFLLYNVYHILAKTNKDSNPFIAASAHLPGQRDMDLDIHNYGDFSDLSKNATHCKLSGFFITGHAVTAGCVFNNLLATVNGRLSWSVLYCSHICSKEQAWEYSDKTKATLLEAIKE